MSGLSHDRQESARQMQNNGTELQERGEKTWR